MNRDFRLAAVMSVAGRLCVVTGANTGIGRVIATELARAGAHVVCACRSRERTLPVVAAIRQETRNERVEFRELDLAQLASVRAFASELLADKACGPVAVLCNNAGLMAPAWACTEDGYEVTWQTNALAPWLLTQLLLPSLASAAAAAGGAPGSARVVNVGSRLEKTGSLADLQSEPDARKRFSSASSFSTFPCYGTSKAALSALTFEQARRAPPGVAVSLCTPGMVNTELSRFAPAWLRFLSAPLRWAALRTPAAGADTPAWLCASDDAEAAGANGGYFYDRKRIAASAAACSEDNARALWATVAAQSGYIAPQ